MPGAWRWPAVIAASMGLAVVVLAALGSHVVSLESSRAVRLWDTALNIHLFHTIAILCVAILLKDRPSRLLMLCGMGMALGTLLFSGSLYLSAAEVNVLPGKLAPLGGFLMMGSWLGLIIAIVRSKSD